MKKNVLRFLKILCLMLAFALTVGVLQQLVLVHADHNRQRINGFYEEKENSLDIVLLGASEVYSDFAPAHAYEHAGVTSYLFATQANSILSYKSALKNILDRQKDALIVIELNGAVNDEAETTKEANLHNYADNVPLDMTKLEWLSQGEIENKEEYLFPIIKYHSLWSNNSESEKYMRTISDDKTRGYCLLKGILNETAVFKSTQRSMNQYLQKLADGEGIPHNSIKATADSAQKQKIKERIKNEVKRTDDNQSKKGRKPLPELEEKALRELLSYCREQNLENVVFARFPHIVVKRTFDRFEKSNTVGDIVEEYGYDYLNFERDFVETGLDETSDFYNLDHLNVRGQQKFTAYLTDYLTARYAVAPKEQSEKIKAEWKKCGTYYKAYVRYSEELIAKGEKRELSEDYELINKLGDYIYKQ